LKARKSDLQFDDEDNFSDRIKEEEKDFLPE
jgi:hypothetical protein